MAPPGALPGAAPASRTGIIIAVTLAVLALVGGGVLVWLLTSGGDDQGATSGPTATASSTTGGSGETTTSGAASTSTSTTTTSTTTTPPDPTVYFAPPDPSPGTVASNYGAGMRVNGTGCASPEGPATGYWTLFDDGTWFGFITNMGHDSWGGGWIEFDMGCFYEGSAAATEAAHDGQVPYRGFYVRNDYLHLFRPDVESSAEVLWVDAFGDHREAPFSDWPDTTTRSALDCPGARCAVWIYVRNGDVYRIVEQPDVIATAAN